MLTTANDDDVERILDLPVEFVPVHATAATKFMRVVVTYGVVTVRDLAKLTEKDVLEARGVGRHGLARIAEALVAIGVGDVAQCTWSLRHRERPPAPPPLAQGRPRDRAAEPHVYFIQAGVAGPVKVGVADRPWRRLAGLQIGNPERLTIIRLIRHGGIDGERELHRRFLGFRLSGEWFRWEGEFRKYVESLPLEEP